MLGSLRPFARDPLGFLTGCAREYGDVVRIRFLNRHVFLLNDLRDVEAVLATQASKFRKPASLRTPGVRRIMGLGLVTSDGEFWRRQRRLAQPAFHRERIAGYAGVAAGFAARMVESWPLGRELDLQKEMMALTLRIVAKTLFDAEIHDTQDEIGESLDTCIEMFARQWTLSGIFLQGLPTPTWRRLQAAAARLDEVIHRIIREHRAGGTDRGDLLSMLLAAQDDDGARMTDQQLRDEALTLFLAGHETTANALCWTWHLLMQSPGAVAALEEEVDEVLGDRLPRFEDLPRLRYTEQVVKESMRLYPPVWAVGREVVEDFTAGGFRIPAGAQIVISQWILHRDRRWFDAPEEFRPERWAEGLAERLPKYAYIPFSAGPRNCIGSSFAMMEAMVILAVMVSRARLQRAGHGETTAFPSITLRPSGNVQVTVSRRPRSPAG